MKLVDVQPCVSMLTPIVALTIVNVYPALTLTTFIRTLNVHSLADRAW